MSVCLPFGFSFASFFFSEISDAIRYIMICHDYPNMSNYIDDFIYCDLFPIRYG